MPFPSKTVAGWTAAIAIAAVAGALLVWSAISESAIFDESAHIGAGYSYVRFFDYRLNPEHPPLVKALAALPLLFQKLNFPLADPGWTKDVNGQWSVGAKFLYESGNDSASIVRWTRLGPLLLTLALVLFVYFWARQLMGSFWAIVPTFLVGLSPTILAHGHYVTTDVGATLGVVTSLYFFIRALEHPQFKNTIYAGIIFGFAELTKFSAALLIPFFIFLALLFYGRAFFIAIRDASIPSRLALFGSYALKYCILLLTVFLTGFLIIYAVYFLFTLNYPIERQTADSIATLGGFAGGSDPSWSTCNPFVSMPISRHMRCAAEMNIWMTTHAATRPLAQYLLGIIMVMERSSGGNNAYFLGTIAAHGWWYYFPIVFLLKESLPSLILIGGALLLALWRAVFGRHARRGRIDDYLGTHFAEFSMAAFIVFYWSYSMKSALNIGIRHIIPTIPFIYLLTAASLKSWMVKTPSITGPLIRRLIASVIAFAKRSTKYIALIFLLAWYSAETLFIAPHFLSYFNQLGGGSDKGYRYVTDSNYDWGQDLYFLRSWTKENRISKIAVNYFGGGSPRDTLGDIMEPWWSARGNPKKKGIEWLAVSINTLQGAEARLDPDQQLRKPEDEYRWLMKPFEPYARAGKSIFIYKL